MAKLLINGKDINNYAAMFKHEPTDYEEEVTNEYQMPA